MRLIGPLILLPLISGCLLLGKDKKRDTDETGMEDTGPLDDTGPGDSADTGPDVPPPCTPTITALSDVAVDAPFAVDLGDPIADQVDVRVYDARIRALRVRTSVTDADTVSVEVLDDATVGSLEAASLYHVVAVPQCDGEPAAAQLTTEGWEPFDPDADTADTDGSCGLLGCLSPDLLELVLPEDSFLVGDYVEGGSAARILRPLLVGPALDASAKVRTVDDGGTAYDSSWVGNDLIEGIHALEIAPPSLGWPVDQALPLTVQVATPDGIPLYDAGFITHEATFTCMEGGTVELPTVDADAVSPSPTLMLRMANPPQELSEDARFTFTVQASGSSTSRSYPANRVDRSLRATVSPDLEEGTTYDARLIADCGPTPGQLQDEVTWSFTTTNVATGLSAASFDGWTYVMSYDDMAIVSPPGVTSVLQSLLAGGDVTPVFHFAQRASALEVSTASVDGGNLDQDACEPLRPLLSVVEVRDGIWEGTQTDVEVELYDLVFDFPVLSASFEAGASARSIQNFKLGGTVPLEQFDVITGGGAGDSVCSLLGTIFGGLANCGACPGPGFDCIEFEVTFEGSSPRLDTYSPLTLGDVDANGACEEPEYGCVDGLGCSQGGQPAWVVLLLGAVLGIRRRQRLVDGT